MITEFIKEIHERYRKCYLYLPKSIARDEKNNSLMIPFKSDFKNYVKYFNIDFLKEIVRQYKNSKSERSFRYWFKQNVFCSMSRNKPENVKTHFRNIKNALSKMKILSLYSEEKNMIQDLKCKCGCTTFKVQLNYYAGSRVDHEFICDDCGASETATNTGFLFDGEGVITFG